MSGPGFRPHYTAAHQPATDHKTNITFDVFCPRMVRWPLCRSFWFDILFVEEKTEQNNNPIYCWCSIPQPLPPKKRAWSACHCQYLIPVLKFFAHLKKVSSFQWISISETIWIDRTEAEKYLSASRQKRAIEIYLYKNRHRHTPINIFWQLKFNDLENVKIESFRLV